MILSRLELAIGQIRFAREYTQSLLTDLEPSDWFKQPAEGVSHVAWQVGHLAMAQYGLCLFRMRGRADVDLELMTSAFRKKFSKGTSPDPDPTSRPRISGLGSEPGSIFSCGWSRSIPDTACQRQVATSTDKFAGGMAQQKHKLFVPRVPVLKTRASPFNASRLSSGNRNANNPRRYAVSDHEF